MAVNFMSLDRLHSDLDDDQFAAVTAPLGDALCIANAGAGKTRVLTYRVALFLAQNVPASSICMLTFTRKAAEEMRDRIKEMRELFVTKLSNLGVKRDFSFISQQYGMFSFSGLSKEQVARLKDEFGIYIVGSGRISVAGITTSNIDPLCEAIAKVL